MQLFITNYIRNENTIILTEERVVHQLKNVLRAKVGDTIMVQSTVADTTTRITCVIDIVEKEKITTIVKEQNIYSVIDLQKNLFVALPNKFEKMELIVQKCTEIWLQHIIFFVSQYSQLHDISDNKMQRLRKIALEATEQSYGISVPTIVFSKKIAEEMLWEEYQNFLMHQDWENLWAIKEKNIFFQNNIKKNIFIWPEWWRWTNDEKIFSQYKMQKVSLWKNILRTETAAIVVAWELVK